MWYRVVSRFLPPLSQGKCHPEDTSSSLVEAWVIGEKRVNTFKKKKKEGTTERKKLQSDADCRNTTILLCFGTEEL